jgi:hypothetical protein
VQKFTGVKSGFKREKKMLKYRKVGVAVDIRLPEFLQHRAMEEPNQGVRNRISVECGG